MKTNKTKKLILMVLLMLVLICIAQSGVEANFQSSPNATATTNTLANWMLKVRQMEAGGQVMGLSESLASTSTLLSSTSNNIDVHLQKNTEYGAMLILGVSDYGKQGNGTSGSDYIVQSTATGIATTTGNTSGVYNLGSTWEWTAAGLSTAFSGYNSRYYNLYTTTQTGLRGDATIETQKWQGSSDANWVTSGCPAFLRGFNGTFSYYYSSVSNSLCARAVVVCGSGF